jgi:hypothetical protein
LKAFERKNLRFPRPDCGKRVSSSLLQYSFPTPLASMRKQQRHAYLLLCGFGSSS